MAAGLLVCGTSSDAGKILVVTGLSRAWSAPRPARCALQGAEHVEQLDGLSGRRGDRPGSTSRPRPPGSSRARCTTRCWSSRAPTGRHFLVVDGRPAGILLAGSTPTGRARLRAGLRGLRPAARRPGVDIVVVAEVRGLAGRRSASATATSSAWAWPGVRLPRWSSWAISTAAGCSRRPLWHLGAARPGPTGRCEPSSSARFRGDHAVLQPGLDRVSELTGIALRRDLPWLPGVWLDSGTPSRRGAGRPGPTTPEPAVGRGSPLPRTSDATDVDPLAVTRGRRPGHRRRTPAVPPTCSSCPATVARPRLAARARPGPGRR